MYKIAVGLLYFFNWLDGIYIKLNFCILNLRALKIILPLVRLEVLRQDRY